MSWIDYCSLMAMGTPTLEYALRAQEIGNNILDRLVFKYITMGAYPLESAMRSLAVSNGILYVV